MIRSLACCLVLQSCLFGAGQYSMTYTETVHWYDHAGVQKDASLVYGEISLALADGKQISVDPRTMRLHADDGANILRYQPEVMAVFSKAIPATERTPATYVDLSEGTVIKWRIGDQEGSSTTWRDMERRMYECCATKKLDLTAVMPGAWFLARTPLILHVDEGLRVGDEVNIPYREHIAPRELGTTGRTARLACISKKDGVAVLTSNYTYDDGGSYISWHARVEFDVKRQQLLRVAEERLTKLRSLDSKEIQVVSGVIQCQLKQ